MMKIVNGSSSQKTMETLGGGKVQVEGISLDANDEKNIVRFSNYPCIPNMYYKLIIWEHNDQF